MSAGSPTAPGSHGPGTTVTFSENSEVSFVLDLVAVVVTC